jgi:hypothetical protein
MKRIELTSWIGLFLAFALFVGSAQATIDDHGWAAGGQSAEPSVIYFIGTLIEFHPNNGVPGGKTYWTVKVDEIQVGTQSLAPDVNVITYQSTPPPWGSVDPGLKANDRVWIFGEIVSDSEVTLHGSTDYYLKKAPTEIKLDGTALAFHKSSGLGGGTYWTIKVDHVISGPRPCSRVINVVTFAPISPIPWGLSDPRIKPGNKVQVFGTYHTEETLSPGKCEISLFGSKKYFIKRQIRPKRTEDKVIIMTS